MSLTKNFKRIGMAAHNEARENRDYVEAAQAKSRKAFSERWDTALSELQILDPNGWESWYDAQLGQTAGQMLPLIEARVLALRDVRETGDNVQLVRDNQTPVEVRAWADDDMEADADTGCQHRGGRSAQGNSLFCHDCRQTYAPRNYAEQLQVQLYGNGKSLAGFTRNDVYMADGCGVVAD